MSKHTQIDKIEGTPFLSNHYALYENGRIVHPAIHFDVLAASPELLEALIEIEKGLSTLDAARLAAKAIGKLKGYSIPVYRTSDEEQGK